MKIIFSLLLLLPILACAAGSFRYVQELRPLLEQRKDVLFLFEQSFWFEESGSAGRIGQSVNPKLGGTRIGPYVILAQSKGTREIFWYEITFHTDKSYLDSIGNTSDLRNASQVVEAFTSVQIKPLDFEKNATVLGLSK